MTGMFSSEIFLVIAFSLVGIAFFLYIYWRSKKKDKEKVNLKDSLLDFLKKLKKQLEYPRVSFIDVLPWVVAFAFFPFFHLYCYERCIGTFCTLFSTLVQIFGALLGLLFVAFCYIRKNFEGLIDSYQKNLKELEKNYYSDFFEKIGGDEGKGLHENIIRNGRDRVNDKDPIIKGLVKQYQVIISRMVVIVSYSIIILALSSCIITTGLLGGVIFYFLGILIPILALISLGRQIMFVLQF